MNHAYFDKFIIIFIMLITPAFFFACADASNDPFNSGEPAPLGEAVGSLLLFSHDITGANNHYKMRFVNDPKSADDAVGYAITEILLLPYHSATVPLIKKLGGKGALNRNRDVLYDKDSGLISLLAQGTPWESDGGFSGIRSIIGEDLPWTIEELEDPAFGDSLNISLNTLKPDLIQLANALNPIINAIEVGLKDDQFIAFDLPGEVFSNNKLTLSLNKADLATISGALHFVRAGVYFLAAYDYDFKISDLGTKWENIAKDDPLYKENYTSLDYRIEFLDSRVFRKVTSKPFLATAGKEAQAGIQSIIQALDITSTAARFGALAWNNANKTTLGKAITFLQAIQKSVEGPSELPYVDPTLSLDLSTFFKEGKTLKKEIPWYEIQTVQDPQQNYTERRLTKESGEEFLEGIFSPTLDDWKKGDFSASKDFEELLSSLTENLADDVKDSYGN